ncbi:hypothetical protein [Bacillus alveayuensis]|jgi:hypothetical protein|uniref:hypothetical protein n=1 Tax=Aeribacillus alveayuensis TaxID=279215 RepID=UPI0005CD002F|nr:hypothetical protein [Bacillus alveayuensis]
MLKKLLKAIMKERLGYHRHHKHRWSSSDHLKMYHSKTHHSQYGHYHYKKKYHSGSFFSSFLDS